MNRSQLVTLFIAVALVVSAGSYLANVTQRRAFVKESQKTAAKTCVALRKVLETFEQQEHPTGDRKRAFQESLSLVEDC